MNKILLVEDEVLMVNMYQTLLTTKGFEVDVASDGDQCLKKIQETDYALVLLDVMMPNKDGLITLKEIRAQDKFKKLPIIVLSNLGSENIISEAYDMGVSQYFVKSDVDNEELVKAVNEIINSQK